MVAACPFPEPRGTPTRILRLAEALAVRGHEIHVVTYHLGHPAPVVPFAIHRIPRVRTYTRHAPGPDYQKLLVLDPLLAVRIMAVLRRRPIDLIHAHHFEGALSSYPAARLFRKPLIFDAHTLLESELPSYGMGLSVAVKKRIGRFLDRLVPRTATHVIAVSDEIRDKLLAQGSVDPERLSVIPNGVETELFEPAAAPAARAGGAVLVFAGNLAAYQRIDLLLRIFARVSRIRGEVRLKILTTSDFGPYETMARQLGVRDRIDVQPCDFPELAAVLAAADVGLSPRTECDGMPQKILNYMAAGLPVVAFAGSAKNMVHRQHGLIVPEEDETRFAEAILEILADHGGRRIYGANARKFVSENMSWARAARDVEALYRKLLAPVAG